MSNFVPSLGPIYAPDSLARFHCGQEWRVLGRTPPTARFVGGPALPAIPESQWSAMEVPTGPIVIKDQDGRGACQGHTDAEVVEWDCYLQFGPSRHVPLSGWFPYAILCGGVDRGSSISDGLTISTTKGIAPESEVQYGIINPARLTAAAYAAALRHRLEVGAMLTTFEELVTAALLKLPYNVSICVGGSFNNLDADGVVGFTRGMGNHSVTGVPGVKRTKSGEWALKFQNHWTTKWGRDGYGWFTRRHWEQQNYAEAYVGRAAIADPQDPHRPPVAP